MRILARIVLACVFVAAIGLVIFLIREPKRPDVFATLTAVLAVIAAVISAWPALRTLEIQEDATRPCPNPYFDLTSRYGLVLLRVKNTGAGVAHSVEITWSEHPRDEDGDPVTMLDRIPVPVPQHSVSVNVGRSHVLFKKYSSMCFKGTVQFSDSSGRRMKQSFTCSADQYRSSLYYDDEMLRTLYEVQKIPKALAEIEQAVREAAASPHERP